MVPESDNRVLLYYKAWLAIITNCERRKTGEKKVADAMFMSIRATSPVKPCSGWRIDILLRLHITNTSLMKPYETPEYVAIGVINGLFVEKGIQKCKQICGEVVDGQQVRNMNVVDRMRKEKDMGPYMRETNRPDMDVGAERRCKRRVP